MNSHKIPYKKTLSFSKIVEDYLDERASKMFYNRFPVIENIKDQIHQRSKQSVNREVLLEVIASQYKDVDLTQETNDNILLLKEKNTYTIATGHQLCLFGGPLYFLYKIISTINLAETLNKKFSNNNFVPIFWMASEDHDFSEVNHVYLFGRRYEWKTNQTGMVGSFQTSGISQLIDEIALDLGECKNARYLINLFKKCYGQNTLSEATRIFVNELFGKYGIVILDASDARLKKQLIPVIKKDVVEKGLHKIISNTTNALSEKYKAQALVREINFFKLSNGQRSRITDGIHNSEVDDLSESFSPNVLMRPIYQELILPNLAYIGGGSEIAYWMQLKSAFKELDIVFPMLLLRNSVMWIESKDYLKWKKFGLHMEDIFLSEQYIQKKFIEKKDSFNTDDAKEKLESLYCDIKERTNNHELKSLINAELKSQLKSLEKINKKHRKISKLQNEISLKQISKIKRKLFPDNVLQERKDNFILYYLQHGETFISRLKEEIDPLDRNFLILSPKDNRK